MSKATCRNVGPVVEGRTYWGIHMNGLKWCRVAKLLPNDNAEVVMRCGSGPIQRMTAFTSLLRCPSAYVYATKLTALQVLFRQLLRKDRELERQRQRVANAANTVARRILAEGRRIRAKKAGEL